MKQNIFKIVVIVSSVLGLVGPQVALGKSVEVNTTTSPQVVTPDVTVVSAPSGVASVVSQAPASTAGCNTQSDSVRLDLLLLQGCNSLAVAPVESLPNLAIVSEPVYLPSIAIQDKVNFATPVTINSTQSTQVSILPVSGLLFKTLKTTTSVAITSVSLKPESSNLFNNINQLSSVMLRC